jgi:hypothetical protein
MCKAADLELVMISGSSYLGSERRIDAGNHDIRVLKARVYMGVNSK